MPHLPAFERRERPRSGDRAPDSRNQQPDGATSRVDGRIEAGDDAYRDGVTSCYFARVKRPRKDEGRNYNESCPPQGATILDETQALWT